MLKFVFIKLCNSLSRSFFASFLHRLCIVFASSCIVFFAQLSSTLVTEKANVWNTNLENICCFYIKQNLDLERKAKNDLNELRESTSLVSSYEYKIIGTKCFTIFLLLLNI